MGSVACGRAYYYCSSCGSGFCPWDEAVGLTTRRLTPAAEQAAALAGVTAQSFDQAADSVLTLLAGLRLSESTVRRTTEDAGQRVGQLLADGQTLGFPQHFPWHRDARGRTCAYVSIDATGVRQQAADGGPAESRMPYVAMVFNPIPDLPDDSPYAPSPQAESQARYLSGLYDLATLGTQLRRQGGQVGMNQAEQWIALTDGGAGLEEFVRQNFPGHELVPILDFWHAAEYLRELAAVLHPQDEAARATQFEVWRQRLRDQGGKALIAHLEEFVGAPRRPAVQEKLAEVLRYFGNNVARMDYPRYRASGWQIGSGAVESGCKTVVGQRLKLAGMRWREPGTDALCHLRALFRSGPAQWEAFWKRTVQTARGNACSTN